MDMPVIDLQKLNYFAEGNLFTGSCTKDREEGLVIRYFVRPDVENQRLQAFCWDEDLAFDKARNKDEKDFPLTQDGLDGLMAWLQEHYARLA